MRDNAESRQGQTVKDSETEMKRAMHREREGEFWLLAW